MMAPLTRTNALPSSRLYQKRPQRLMGRDGERRNFARSSDKQNVMERDLCFSLWEAHCAKSPTAFNRLFDALLPPLLRKLEAKFPTMPAGDREDAASEAFLLLVVKPEAFDPTRAALPTFLYVVACNKLTDKYRAAKRSNTVSLDLENEAFFRQVQTEDVESQAEKHRVFGAANPHDTLRPDVQAWLHKVLPAPRDRALFLMTTEEPLTVEAFAVLFDMQTLPLNEQRREMKRNRDRIQKRVARDGAAVWVLIHDAPLPKAAPFAVSKSGTSRKP